MSAQPSYKNYTGTDPGAEITIPANSTIARVTVSGTAIPNVIIQLKDPAGMWIPVPTAESDTTADTYDIIVYPNEIYRANITSGTATDLNVFIKPIGKR